MLPLPFQAPAAVLLLLGGILACFAGYRLFRLVLGIYGFLLGAYIATSLLGPAETLTVVLVAVGGGLVGALIFILAYFVGVALIGAGIGALLAHLAWTQFGQEPHVLVVILFAVLGALGAIVLQRHVIIVGTAFAGAWTTLVGAMALLGDARAARAADGLQIWTLYPMHPAPEERWILAAWVALGLVGMLVQLVSTSPRRRARRT